MQLNELVVLRLHELSPAATRVYLAYCVEQRHGRTEISDQDLAFKYSLSRSRVAEARGELEAKAWISRSGSRGAGFSIQLLVGFSPIDVSRSRHKAAATVENSTQPASVENSTVEISTVENSTQAPEPVKPDSRGDASGKSVEISTQAEKIDPPVSPLPPLHPPFPPISPRSDSETSVSGEKGSGKKGRAISPTAYGSRLPDEFHVTAAMKAWAAGNNRAGIRYTPAVDLVEATEAFCDHFRSAAGAKGRKTDWEGTWRNWIRNDYAKLKTKIGGQKRNGNGNFSGSKDAHVDRALENLANDPAFGYSIHGR